VRTFFSSMSEPDLLMRSGWSSPSLMTGKLSACSDPSFGEMARVVMVNMLTEIRGGRFWVKCATLKGCTEAKS